MGLREFSMRPASIGPVKEMLRRVDLNEARDVINESRKSGAQSVRKDLTEWLSSKS
jgi:phosphotransferase system enzyme I (PtsP)